MWNYTYNNVLYEINFYYKSQLSSYWKEYNYEEKSLLEIKKNLSSYVLRFSQDIIENNDLSVEQYLNFIDIICSALKDIQNT